MKIVILILITLAIWNPEGFQEWDKNKAK